MDNLNPFFFALFWKSQVSAMLHFVETAEFGKFKLKGIHCRVDMGQIQTVIQRPGAEIASISSGWSSSLAFGFTDIVRFVYSTKEIAIAVSICSSSTSAN